MSTAEAMSVRHPPRLSLESLEHALLVLDLGSFRKAAEVLRVQPSVVSRRVRMLEDAIGVGLFQRQAAGAEPTPAGLLILKRVRRAVDEIGLVIRVGRQAGEGQLGVLRLGIIASIAGGRIRELLENFLEAHPGIELDVVEASPADNVGEVRALRLDAAVVVGSPPAPGCVIEPMWSEPIFVVLPDRSPLAEARRLRWSDLHDQRFLVNRGDPGPEIRDYVVQHLASLGHRPIVDARPVGRDALMALVGLGLGISLISNAEAAVTYPGVIYRLLDDEPLPYSVVWSEKNDNPLLRRFMSLARRRSTAWRTAAVVRTLDPSP